MADITMCLNVECPIKHFCYRHTAKSSNYQSYSWFNFYVMSDNKVKCDNFLTTKERKQ